LASVIVAQGLTGIGQAVTVLLVVPLLDAVGVGGQSALRRSIRVTNWRRAPEMCSDPQVEQTRQELPTRHIYLADASQAGLLAFHRSDSLGQWWIGASTRRASRLDAGGCYLPGSTTT
jgi:hypothetical protein